MINKEQKDKIIEILDRNEYRVLVQNIDNGILAIYPQRVEYPSIHQSFFYYTFDLDKLNITVKDAEGNIKVNFDHKCPWYAQKLLVLSDILTRCTRINYSIPFIKYIIEGEEVEDEVFFAQLDTEPSEQTEMLKPIVFSIIYGEGADGADAISKTLNVYDGYIAIKKFLELSYGKQ